MRAYAATDTGKVRLTNQDSVFCAPFPIGNLPNLFMVADGMGGHRGGDFASKFTIDTIVSLLGTSAGNNPITLLSESIKQANGALIDKANEDTGLYGMGTTLVAASISDRMMCVANVGDSRLYIINHEIRQITRDHSLVEEMISRGRMMRDSIPYYENKNIITRAIGAKKNVQIDFFEIMLNPADIILLCSDGLSNMVSDEMIKEIILEENDLKHAAEKLVATANDSGGMDNISVVLIKPMVDEVEEC